jgi:YVTN family beta-propeller protein
MGTVVFGGSFSFITAATPSSGWVVGYDTDGIIKQKDSSGVITPIGGGLTAGNSGTYSLSQVLAINNNSQNYSLIMGTSTSIKSARGGGQLDLDYNSNQVLISNDNGTGNKSKIYISDDSVDIVNTTDGSRVSLKSDKIDIVNGSTSSGPTGNRVFINSNKSDGKILLGVNTNIDIIKISATQGSTNTTTNSTKEGVIISSQNSYFESSVRNSVILGGNNVYGVSSDSVYIPRVIIPEAGTIGTETSNSNIEFNNETINLYNLNSIIAISTSTSSLSKNGIILVDTTSDSTSPNVDSGVAYINTKNSSATSSINNSVVIGGQNINAILPDTVYLGNSVNINNAYTLPSTDGTAGYILKTDGSGNVTWEVDGGSDAKALDLTLSKGNNSATYSLVMGTGTSIKSSNGGGQIDLDFSTLSNRVLISTDNGGISTAYIELDNSDINIESTGNLKLTANSSDIQIGDGTGIQYSSDYSSGYVDRSLVDKGYVDGGTASIWTRISNAATGSGTSNYIPKWNSTTNLSGTSSIYVSNATTENVVENTLTGNNDPYDVAFDSYNGRFYVVNSGSNNVTVRNSNTLALIGTVSVGNYPNAITFDSYNNRMYVANKNSNNVSVINTSTNTVIATISVGTFPIGIEFDKINNRVYVSCQTSNEVSIISTSTNTVIGTITTSTPRGLAYDFNNNNLYVSGVGPDKVACIDLSTNSITATVSVGTNPYGLSYDSINKRIYVANYVSNNISVINTLTNAVISTFGVGSNPDSIEFDILNSRMYVTNYSSSSISVVSTLTNTVVSTITLLSGGPRGLAIDSLNSKIYVANFGNDTTEVIETLNRKDGYIGLNTANPTSELDVRGKVTTKEFRLTTSANSGYYLVSDGNGNGTWQYPIIEIIGGTGLTGSGTAGVISLNVDLEENSGLTFSGGEITIDYSMLSSTIQGGGLTANAGVLDVNVGNGLTIIDDYVQIDQLSAGNGLTFSSGVFSVNTSNGLIIIGDSVQIDQSVSGTGLTFSSGVMSVNLGQNSGLTFSGDDIIVDTNIAGNGLDISSGVLTVNTSEITPTLAGNGLTANGSTLDVNVGNGLQLVSDQIYLGGTLSESSTTINGNNFNFSIEGSYDISFTASNEISSKVSNFDGYGLNFITANGVESTLFYYGNGVGGSTFSKVSVNTNSAYLAVQNAGSSYSTIAAYSNGSYLSNDTSANNSLVVIDEISYKGLIYKDDYSFNFTTYSLVTKGYVDTQVGTSTSKYATIVSFTASVTQTITHSLGTDEIIVQAYDSTGVMVIPGIVQINGTNDVDITFSSTLSSIKIIVIG